MSVKKNRGGIEITRYLTAVFAEGYGAYPDGYDEEMHRDMGEHQCSICGRLYKDHTPQEFLDHLERSRVPVVLTPEQIEQVKDMVRKDPRLTPEQAEEAIGSWEKTEGK